jgi:hypothetical protein
MVRTSRLAARLFPLLTRTKWKKLYSTGRFLREFGRSCSTGYGTSSGSGRQRSLSRYCLLFCHQSDHSLVTSCGAPVHCFKKKAIEEYIRFLESCVENPLTRHPLFRFYTFEEEVRSL